MKVHLRHSYSETSSISFSFVMADCLNALQLLWSAFSQTTLLLSIVLPPFFFPSCASYHSSIALTSLTLYNLVNIIPTLSNSSWRPIHVLEPYLCDRAAIVADRVDWSVHTRYRLTWCSLSFRGLDSLKWTMQQQQPAQDSVLQLVFAQCRSPFKLRWFWSSAELYGSEVTLNLYFVLALRTFVSFALTATGSTLSGFSWQVLACIDVQADTVERDGLCQAPLGSPPETNGGFSQSPCCDDP